MCGIYIHIPFCRQVCHYCDFFRTASLKMLPDYLAALEKEIILQKSFLDNHTIETIYFGGGTPSVLSIKQIDSILNSISKHYNVISNAEITLEANPDDLSTVYLNELKLLGVNRLSIGIQSFNNNELKFMNRRHTAEQAKQCVADAQKAGFDNISIDLIYGLPNSTIETWNFSLETALEMNIQHISAYHLGVEERTYFHKLLKNNKLILLPETISIQQFKHLIHSTAKQGMIHYEISNFAFPNFHSKHNSAYWEQKTYLGLGASAHSFKKNIRQWNFSSLQKYIEAINSSSKFYDHEVLSEIDMYNDYIITTLRTNKGVNTAYIEQNFSELLGAFFKKNVKKHIENGNLKTIEDRVILSEKGIFISDGIIENLFYINESGLKNQNVLGF